jgi:hypothetical protein
MRGGCINCSIPAMDAIRYCIKRMIMSGMAICVGRAGVAINPAVKCRSWQAMRGCEAMPQFTVTVMREMDAYEMAPDAALVVTAIDEVAAAAMALRALGGGYADAIDVSPPDAVSVEMEALSGIIKGTSFLYCTFSAGAFTYDVRCSSRVMAYGKAMSKQAMRVEKE